MLLTVVFTPNITLTKDAIAIENFWSTKRYSPQEFDSISRATIFYSKINFTTKHSHIFMNGTDILDYLTNSAKARAVETELNSMVQDYYSKTHK
ncbi:hypothetical protein BXP70_05755 [Hymenobacter crusticola]|uniref:Uncharacterized protein n=1 Tax=Hymenobacter crusticola TaxID=1770526 RepID=A0A243WIX4_9BACT|nr:hypothetical protein BXP70_05755 [Hymenobacter crusticola]